MTGAAAATKPTPILKGEGEGAAQAHAKLGTWPPPAGMPLHSRVSSAESLVPIFAGTQPVAACSSGQAATLARWRLQRTEGTAQLPGLSQRGQRKAALFALPGKRRRRLGKARGGQVSRTSHPAACLPEPCTSSAKGLQRPGARPSSPRPKSHSRLCRHVTQGLGREASQAVRSPKPVSQA